MSAHQTPSQAELPAITEDTSIRTKLGVIVGLVVVLVGLAGSGVSVAVWVTTLHGQIKQSVDRNTIAVQQLKDIVKKQTEHEARLMLIERTRYTREMAEVDRSKTTALMHEVRAMREDIAEIKQAVKPRSQR